MKDIVEKLKTSHKAVILYGPRQAGKTTLCKDIIKTMSVKTLYINADEARYIEVLSSRDARQLSDLVSGYQLVVIDEAQRVPDIGINLKILIDAGLGVKILATGSSSFDLANKVQEPLTGRHWTYFLYPISHLELRQHFNRFEMSAALEERLVWGSYPELFSLAGRETKATYLRTLTSDYLYKDILALADIRHAGKIRDLLKLIAFQVGNQASLSELASSLDMSKETVARYIDLLEQSFVIFRLGGFSRNLRKEISKTHKYYFYDVGVRNGIIENFQPLSLRNDVGALWENFLLAERLKRNAYLGNFTTPYFWRTYTGAEIDYIEERSGELSGYEFTWGAKHKSVPPSWNATYKQATWQAVDRNTWIDFVV